jgi:hypothetical protein
VRATSVAALPKVPLRGLASRQEPVLKYNSDDVRMRGIDLVAAWLGIAHLRSDPDDSAATTHRSERGRPTKENGTEMLRAVG